MSQRSTNKNEQPFLEAYLASRPNPPETEPLATEDAPEDPEVEALVTEMIGRVADKWTMLILEELTEHGTVRFTRLGELVSGISQKMLTKTLRQLESDGLVKRRVHPVIPPHVDYQLTHLGLSLSEAFCGVWVWAAKHHSEVAQARQAYQARVGEGL
jgi:DNA-binding HxlR family transcriptional regulator